MFRNLFNHRSARNNHRERAVSAPVIDTTALVHAARRRDPKSAVRQAAFEALEGRQLFSGVLGGVAGTVDGALGQIDAALGAVENVQNKLPVLGKNIADVPAARNTISNFRHGLHDKLAALDNATGPQALRGHIYDALSNVPGVGNIVGDTNGNGVAGEQADVMVNEATYDLAAGNVAVKVDLKKETQLVNDTFDFATGLDGLPLRVDAQANVNVGVGFSYDDFSFGAKGGVPYFDVAAADEFKIDLNAYVGAELHGTLGFLRFSATDATGVNDPELSAHFSLDVTNQNGSYGLTPKLNANAHIDLDLKAEVNAADSLAYPSIESGFQLDWNFINVDPKGAHGSFGSAPSVQFDDVKMNLGSFLDTVAGPLIDAVHEVTKPLQPIIDVLTTELPVLTDLSEAIGGGPVSILDMVDWGSGIDGVPDDVKLYADMAVEVVNIINTINDIKSAGQAQQSLVKGQTQSLVQDGTQELNETADVSNYFIDFGSFDLGGAADALNGDLRAVPAALFDAAQGNWTNLVPANLPGGIDLGTIKAKISQELGDVGDMVNSVIDRFTPSNNGINLSFPLVDSPASGIFKLMLGQDVDLVSFKATLDNVEAQESTSLPLGGFGIDFAAGVSADADFRMAYDTYGLREFVTGIANGNGDVGTLADGLYIDAGSHLDVLGKIEATVSASYLVFSAQLAGGVDAGLHLGMDTSGNADGDGKIRVFTELGDNIFQASGKVSGYLDFTVKVGVEVLGEFIGWAKTWHIAEGTILQFATAAGESTGIANPFQVPDPPHLGVKGAGGVLTLNVGTLAGNRLVGVGETAEQYHVGSFGPSQGGGETIVLYAFGASQTFTGVTSIVGDGGSDDDLIVVDGAVAVPATLHGGVGNDTLDYRGSGAATLYGDDGNDVLKGGAGANTLFGGNQNDQLVGGSGGPAAANFLYGEYGDDVLVGMNGDNELDGGFENDLLQAGPNGDYMDGGSGDDDFTNGPGADEMIGNRGNDTMAWNVGDGDDTFDGREGYDALSMFGTDAADTFVLTKAANGGDITVQAPGAALLIKGTASSEMGTEELSVAGGKAADSITVNDLTGTPVKAVGVNLGDVIDLDNVKDSVTVYGTTGNDTVKVEVESALLKGGTRLRGGITRISGLPSYTVRAANVADSLTLDVLDGADDVDVLGVTGPTQLNTGAGDDTVDVLPSALNQFLDTLGVDAGAGSNTLRVIENTTVDEAAVLTGSGVTSKLLPMGVSYAATGGSFGGGVQLTTGGGADSVVVKSTLPGVATLVRMLGNNDVVTVSSDGTAAGNLAMIRGTLTVDGGAGANKLSLVDRGAGGGNANASVAAAQVLNFAGPADDAVVNFQSLGGAMTVVLEGSDAASVAEGFRLDNPSQAVVVNANGGNDSALVRQLSKPATLSMGGGNDAVTVSSAAGTLDLLAAPLSVTGGDGLDSLTAGDQGAGSGKGYTLTATTLTRSGAAAITYAVEDLTVQGTGFGDNFVVSQTPATAVTLSGNAGTDSVIGPNTNNVWDIDQQDGGRLNATVRFTSAANLTGGTLSDLFRFSDGKGVSGNLIGDSGVDTLDYAVYTSAVTVDLPGSKATGVGGLAQLFENVTGGAGDDLILGNASNNVLKGSAGNDVLVGGDGADILSGDAGRDILVGGLGGDQLDGGSGEDVLADGTTAHDADKVALRALMAEWKRADAGYAARVSHLRNGGAGALNGSYKLKASTVFSDASVDSLTGGSESDWYWAKAANPADVLVGKVSTEVLN